MLIAEDDDAYDQYLRRVRFDPEITTDDRSVGDYHARINALPPTDRQQLHASVPFDNRWRSNDARFKILTDFYRQEQESRIILLAGNLLIDMAKKVFPNAAQVSIHELQQSAARGTAEQFRNAGIPTKYWPFLRNLRKYVAERNTMAHESAPAFAHLLNSDMFRDSPTFHKWKEAFPILYGSSIEDLAGQYQDPTRDLL